MRLGAILRCDGCGKDIDPSGPGVTKSANTEAWWQPFLEDLRSDRAQHWHHFASRRRSGPMHSSMRSTARISVAGSAQLPL